MPAGGRIAFTAALAILAAPPSQAKVVGADDRVRLEGAEATRFGAVGRLVCIDPATNKRGISTMTLVGDRRTIIGVGHFGETSDTVKIAIKYCQFELYGRYRTRLFQSGIAAVRAHRFTRNRKANIRTADWAVLQLQDEAPPIVTPLKLRPMSVSDLVANPKSFLVSFHRDTQPGAKIFSPDCRPQAISGQPKTFKHICDTALESSGGLLFLDQDGEVSGVAMNFAQDDTAGVNYGKILEPELFQHLPAGAISREPEQ